MTAVWDKISQLAETIEQQFKNSGQSFFGPEHGYSWYNSLYTSNRYRRAHIEIVDFRQSHNIYIVHSTVFPHLNDPSPIWGFDAVCGPNKITGAFHDFSMPGYHIHPLSQWWSMESKTYKWHKPRALPEWAQMIFSKDMIAAGNVQPGDELDALCTLVTRSLNCYLFSVGMTQQLNSDYSELQNKYCRYQKQNPHVIRSMVSMGIPEDVMKKFVQEVLFPEVS